MNILRFFLAAILLLSCGCQKPLHKETEFYMGTFVEVISEEPRASAIVFDEFRRLDNIFNLFNEESELSKLNARGHIQASSDLFSVLQESKKFFEATDGAFDVTIAPVALLWKEAIGRREVPEPLKIQEAMARVGFGYVYLDEENKTVRLLKEGAMIDLGGIAKGYAVDQAIAKLREAGVTSALVNAGGNLYCLGKNQRRLWRVGLRNPRLRKHLIERFTLKDEAVATSGDYEQYFIENSRRYSHLIDPKTGQPSTSGITSATVIAPNATTADALATAFSVTDIETTRQILSGLSGVGVQLVDAKGNFYEL